MPSQRVYTFTVLLISLTILFAYKIRTPVLPMDTDLNTMLEYHSDSSLNFTKLTKNYGYVSDEHRVVTEDGYVLTMFRIVTAKNCRGKKRSPPVLLMHGFLQSSDSFIDSGPSAGLAYLIADGCYDLWAGNCRGNYYSRSHVKLNPDRDVEFWHFDIEEMGKYDVAAMIDYILKYTRASKLNYIGFSQGAGALFVMCSERPGYCDKIQLFIAMAPATRLLNIKSTVLKYISETLESMEKDLVQIGVTEMFSKGAFSQKFLAFFCQISNSTIKICEIALNMLDHIGEFRVGSLNNATMRTIFDHFPAGTSLHNIAKYGQSVRSERFEKFDYGEEKNLRVYGSRRPPEYQLAAVSVPVVCLHGQSDGLVDVRDVQWLVARLPQVLERALVRDPLWKHLDFTYNQHTREAIMPKINEYLNKYSWS